ncbi:MAG: rRNA maturation RNase YbeY [Synergistaceae bacterium]|nr:rRNA maturation RNase YbeY [Synergistaceae bacterium]
MIINIIVDGEKLISDRIQTDIADFLKKTEALYLSVLQDEESFSQVRNTVEVSLSFVEAGRIRELNQSYRDIDLPTDVLSFPLWEEDSKFAPPEGWECLPLGDIVICPDKTSDNAAENNKSFEEELVLLMSHGLLHLIGYDHYDDDTKHIMWIKQEEMVEQFFREEGTGYDRS